MAAERLIIFAKAPVPGSAKTRMIPALGPEGAAQLSASLTKYALEKFEPFIPALYCYPDEEHSFFRECAEKFKTGLYRQKGNDLGERMQRAFDESWPAWEKVVLIGTDCPELTAGDIQTALDSLDRYETVFIPALDGGYVLVGARSKTPPVFKNISWGSDRVMTQTLQALGTPNYLLLSGKRDFDRPEDLPYFRARFPLLF